MKKKTTSNPLKTFNDNTANAYKKGGIAMKAFKKSLPTAEEGVNTPREERRESRREFYSNENIPVRYKINKTFNDILSTPKKVTKALIDPSYREGRFKNRNEYKYLNDSFNKRALNLENPIQKKGGVVKKKKK